MKSGPETPANGLSPDDERMLRDGAKAVREALSESRSDKLGRLFDYLLEKTLAGESPSEQQISTEAFAAYGNSVGKDPKVRVYIHRLRKLLDTVFADPSSPRLSIPVGEYRLKVESAVGEQEAEMDEPDNIEKPAPPEKLEWTRLAPAALLVAVILVLGALVLMRDRAPLADTALWQPVAETGRPLTVVMGDYYAFSRLDRPAIDPDQGPRFVWDRAVPTREDLTILEMLEPDGAENLVDYNQHFVTGGTIEAISTVRVALSRLPGAGRRQVRLISFSQLTPERLVSDDIVFVGQFGGIGRLIREPLLQATGLDFGPDLEGLVDRESGETFMADNMNLTDERTPRRDFAYIASLSGPAGNRIMVIAGLGDAGVKRAAQLVNDREQLDRLRQGAETSDDGFEALFRVRTLGNVDVGASLIFSRSLRVEDIWDNSGEVPVYRPIDPEPRT
ncbi:hypothetical protein [Croceicoccus sediminis]|uniref:hypothetical protein n=1 Tax=Croceicoccus sediminis TaxID=2571150 RepID=UPI00118224D0|nr:hypothetical protein [Croceicoccus sediminis]